MTDVATDPQQAAVDAAVAAMVASNPAILTAAPVDHEGKLPLAQLGMAPAPKPELHPADATGVPERLRLARERRAAFQAAMAALRTRGYADVGPIRTALANADRDGIITGIVSHALGLFLDENCGRPYTLLHELSDGIEHELVASIYAAPVQILASLPDDGSAEVAYIRQHAIAATTLDEHLFDSRGQPTAPKLPSLSMMQTLVPR